MTSSKSSAGVQACLFVVCIWLMYDLGRPFLGVLRGNHLGVGAPARDMGKLKSSPPAMHEATQSFISLLIIYLANGNIRCPAIRTAPHYYACVCLRELRDLIRSSAHATFVTISYSLAAPTVSSSFPPASCSSRDTCIWLTNYLFLLSVFSN